ncbi:hypothetical protein METP1_00084 [Methanosarcinales archaeon]|nr:hypothetical protein METP1_00084 [Methanosarcinales archaeon]
MTSYEKLLCWENCSMEYALSLQKNWMTEFEKWELKSIIKNSKDYHKHFDKKCQYFDKDQKVECFWKVS